MTTLEREQIVLQEKFIEYVRSRVKQEAYFEQWKAAFLRGDEVEAERLLRLVLS